MLPVSISCFISNIKVFKTLFLRNQLIFLHKLRNNVLYCLIYIFLVLISGTLPNLRKINELKLCTRIHIILTVGTKTINGLKIGKVFYCSRQMAIELQLQLIQSEWTESHASTTIFQTRNIIVLAGMTFCLILNSRLLPLYSVPKFYVSLAFSGLF